jgi:hypothetical protein
LAEIRKKSANRVFCLPYFTVTLKSSAIFGVNLRHLIDTEQMFG